MGLQVLTGSSQGNMPRKTGYLSQEGVFFATGDTIAWQRESTNLD